MPALRALRKAVPSHRIVLGTPARFMPLLSSAALVDAVHPMSGLAAPIDGSDEPPDLAVNMHGRGPQSHRLLADLHPRRLLAFGNAAALVDGPAWDAQEHEVSRWCRLVSETLGESADTTVLQLPAPALEPAVRGAVIVHPGAAFPARRWPPERFAAVASWAAGEGHAVAVTGSADEATLAALVAAKAELPHATVYAGRTSLLELAAMVSHARLVVCGDTGVAHLASAYRSPSVVLFGPTSPAMWGPPADGPHEVIWHGDGSGDPFGGYVDPSLAAIGVEEVIARSELLLSAQATSGRP